MSSAGNKKPLDVLRQTVSRLPDKPGIYQFVDKTGTILYVGKAKNIRKRVGSYFTGNPDGKTYVMLRKSHDIKHMVVETESDALLLENNLIKKWQPRYNILLKDDKSFPWIIIRNERFPRVYSIRQLPDDGSECFGPYTSAVMVRTLLGLIRKLYPLRTCTLKLSRENVDNQKYKPCLEYHLGNCKAPCVGLQEETDYMNSIEHIRQILKGNIHTVRKQLEKWMKEKSAAYRFEEAALIKEKLEILTKFQSRSTIVSPKISHVDVFTIVEDNDAAYVNYLKVQHGAVVQTHNIEMRKKLEESREELLLTAITEIRTRFNSDAPEILVPFPPGMNAHGAVFRIPVRGDKMKLLGLSQRNARYYQMEREKVRTAAAQISPELRIMETIRRDLRLKELPIHMECFDNSNIQGKNPVAACVVFRNGFPSRKDYRHYNIKTVEGIDDVASMEEVVYRRYRRLLDENQTMPQLVIIDGGKGQLNAAVRSIENLGLKGKLSVIGIAKRLEEIYFPGDPVPVYIDKRSETLRIMQHIRNEAHRFGLGFHHQKRSGDFIHSELEEIDGIGKQTVKSLFSHFKSLSGIRNAGFDEWKKLIGHGKAGILRDYFESKRKN